ncbi:hypothetical protein [Congregibacter litoralis]|uniref:Uncharacterized protein n=1 Tax=Congregibacter litoralis KT71 TaxID=314285 RepID=A4A862_9GAMM|nr:hypothetical protein [Congregibacter litoralis]EAQ97857.1 hypothetical protein KT71_14869 [Congregibacter litoralis KT71]
MLRISSLLLFLALAFSPAVKVLSQSQSAIEECKALKERIEDYDDLRKEGGSASQMDRWRRARNELEAEFHDKNCHKISTRLLRTN